MRWLPARSRLAPIAGAVTVALLSGLSVLAASRRGARADGAPGGRVAFVASASLPGVVVPAGAACALPAGLLDLSAWKVTLPLGEEAPLEVVQPELAGYRSEPCFQVDETCAAVQFRAPTSAPTTVNSSYPRSELREMSGDGVAKASWSTTSGVHRMVLEQAITSVPRGKPHVVAGQIHDAGDDVIMIRLEGSHLFVEANGEPVATLDPDYVLGERFRVEIVAADGVIEVYHGGSATPSARLERAAEGCYFKAGVYTQSNCRTEAEAGAACGPESYGEVRIYDLRVEHT